MNLQPISFLLIYSAPKAGAKDPWMSLFPIGLGYIQAMLKSHGFPCLLANLTGMSKNAVTDYIRQVRPTVVGLSMFTFNRKRCCELAKIIRDVCPETVILAGGPHPTHLAKDVFKACPQLDAIVAGEGEVPMLEIIRRMTAGDDWREAPSLILRNGARTPIAEPIEYLDAIGIPIEHFKADFSDNVIQLSYISTSRGCPASCAFCNTPEFWGRRVRFRSPYSVIREMQTLWKTSGLTYFNFRDDTFTTNKARVLNLCEQIKSSGIYPLWSCQSRADLIDEERLVAMVRAGCEFIQFGVEHGSERMLNALGKDASLERVYSALSTVRKVGVNLGIYLITGIPGETIEDVAKSEALINRVLPHNVQISPLAIYPGTRLYSDLIASGAIHPDFYRKSKDIEVFARKHDEIIFSKVGGETRGPALIKVLNAVMVGNERVYVDGHTGEALERLRQTAENVRERARYTPEDFRQQKKFLGWCATTNILCGEAAEDVGDVEEADAQYSEVIKREPNNPWGWLKRGGMYINLEQHEKAANDMREVLKLTPNNYDALDALEYMARNRRKKK